MKNAKLICIKDDNSVIETDEEPESEQKDKQNEKKSTKSSSSQTDLHGQPKKNKSTQRPATTIKRLPKISKQLDTLPKEFAVSVIQYKLDFNKYCKGNSMYKRTSSILPWKLMSK